MALKASYKTAEEIPAEVKAFYRQDGTNGWVLDAEDMVSKKTLDEFRDNNRTLKRQVDEDLTPKLRKYEDVGTVEDFEGLKQRSDELAEGKLVRSGKLEEAVTQRLEKVNSEHQKELTKERTRSDALQKQLSTLMIDNATMEAATKIGARQTALP